MTLKLALVACLGLGAYAQTPAPAAPQVSAQSMLLKGGLARNRSPVSENVKQFLAIYENGTDAGVFHNGPPSLLLKIQRLTSLCYENGNWWI